MDDVPTVGLSRRAWLVSAAALAWLGCRSRTEEVAGDGTLTSPYLAIGDHLARDELDGVAALGAQLIGASEGRTDAAGVAELLAGAGRLGAGDISTVRLAYRKMSAGMVAYLGAALDERAGLELIYCPMAFANEGAYWVQREGQLRNPYEGTMMMRCGARVAWDDHRPGARPAGALDLEGMKS